jgi:hypothetical protein
MNQDSANQLNLFADADPVNPISINYGWFGSIAQFLQIPLLSWLETLSANYQALYQQRATATQKQAWQDCSEILQAQFTQLVPTRPDGADWTLVFEYELPREGGRRPDLVLLAAGQVLVVEFKQKSQPSQSDLDQVAAYARDLATYHHASHRVPVVPILVPTRSTQVNHQQEKQPEVQVLSPTEIFGYLNQLQSQPTLINPQQWVEADYAPLPSVIQAAQTIFRQEPLPQIKQAQSAGIPELLDYLYRLVDTAQAQQQRHLVLITGVPGAGKTLVGLQFVYQHPLHHPAIFLSGNGPLITVLQYALKSKVFVQPVRNFYMQHQVRRQTAPAEHLIVFDEAQRAWDAERMGEKYGIDRTAAGTILQIAERVADWCVVVGLIGEGQEIHIGEEDGIEQWNQALLQAAAFWQLHCAPEQATCFTAVDSQRCHTHDRFNLTTSLRSHLASHVQTWVAQVLTGELAKAAALLPRLRQQGFDAYLTRDLEIAKAYCRQRYCNQPNKRYGLLASSRARNLSAYGIPNDYQATSRLNVGAWYSDPPDSPQSCCALERAVTEFGCQGLELDFPIIGWGDDLRWEQTSWSSSTRQRHVKNPLRLRLNSYRVLLTRGRDGLIIFVPPATKMDSTFEALQSAGLIESEC